MRSPAGHRGRTWSAAAAAALVLCVVAPRPGAAVMQLIGVASADDPFAPLVGVISLLAWAVALWLAVSVLVTVAGECPGWTGRIGRALSRRIVPAAVRRALQLSLGLTVAVSALGATTASAAAPALTAATSTSATPSGPGPVAGSLDWPVAGAVTSSATGSPAAPVAVPTASGATPSPSAAPSAAPSASPSASPAASPSTAALPSARPEVSTVDAARAEADHLRPSLPTTQAATDRPAAAASDRSVLVETGDSLWSISRAHLESGGAAATAADVARAWPQWWEANRQIVGDDPDLVLPGTQLTPPP